MPINFSELLDDQRLRPLWQKASVAAATSATAAPSAVSGSEKKEAPIELGAPHLPIELPHVVLAEFERALRAQFGPSAVLLAHLMQPLRSAMTKCDPKVLVRPNHHLRLATSGGIPELIDRIDDALSGLLAVKR